MFGTGVKRIIKSYEGAERKPQFKITDNVISVVLTTLKTIYDVTDDERRVIEALKGGRKLASSGLTAITEFSKAKTIRLINSLIEKRYVDSTGRGRSIKYFLK